jgi:hypothetical protein
LCIYQWKNFTYDAQLTVVENPVLLLLGWMDVSW